MSHLSYKQILSMMERGIVGKRFPDPPFDFGFRGGHYLGSPGKDIYFSLPYLDDLQFKDVADRFARLFPTKPPGNHVQWAACIRYVYGCFEKQGCLRSAEDKARMQREDPDWELPIRFMDEVADRFKSIGNKYGLVLHYEMLAHRFGDKSLIERDAKHLELMILYYEMSCKLAHEVKSHKHMFTPLHWCGRYLFDFGDKERAASFHQSAIMAMEKHCPDARDGYREKAISSIKQYRACVRHSQWKSFRKWLSKCNNKCLKKVVPGLIK